MRKRKASSIITIDTTTGETKEIIHHYSININQDNFCMIFVDDENLYKINSIVDRKVFDKLAQLLIYNTGEVKLSPNNRKEICTFLGISSQAFSNSLKNLKDLDIIDGNKGFYFMNPAIVWKGQPATRKQVLTHFEKLIAEKKRLELLKGLSPS